MKDELIVLELTGDKDFRRIEGQCEAEMYLQMSEQAQQLPSMFTDMVGPMVHHGQRLLINKRYIQTHKMKDKVVWFEFDNICGDHRSASDYIELANLFSTVFVSNVPTFGEHNEDRAYRFIQLIDEMYDRHIRTVVSTESSPRYLYQGRRYQFEFQRTVSRLAEMQRSSNLLKAV
jgi:cell division protein ZapE